MEVYMCGRFTITVNADTMQQELGLVGMPEHYQPRYNVAPSQPVAVVADGERRQGEWMRWGLIPSWAKDTAIGNRLINARAETLAEKPSFRSAFAKRRCLILADGFYEWQKGAGPDGRAQPYLFRLEDQKPFAFAGLWEFWRSPEGEEVRSCTIITCEANDCVAPVHHRMPVLLSGDNLWNWLSPEQPGSLQKLLQPYPPELMARYPVSTRVNSPDFDLPALIEPVN
jgi:putative SOS response-associated peptidase YedK